MQSYNCTHSSSISKQVCGMHCFNGLCVCTHIKKGICWSKQTQGAREKYASSSMQCSYFMWLLLVVVTMCLFTPLDHIVDSRVIPTIDDHIKVVGIKC